MDARRSVPLVSLAEVLSALSSALDLASGQPDGHTVRSCLIGMRLAEELGLDGEARSALYYALILKDAGCSAQAARLTALFGSDDHAVQRRLRLVDWSRATHAALCGLRCAAMGRPAAARLRHLARLVRAGRGAVRELARIRCRSGAEAAHRLGLPAAAAEAIGAIDEHWDGRGYPDGLRGPAIPLLARIAALAQGADALLTDRGAEAALAAVRARRGTWFDPDLADVVLSWHGDHGWWEGLRAPQASRLCVAAEPAAHARMVDEAGLDEVAEVFAGIVDAKTPFTHQHSRRVAQYARDIGAELGMDGAACCRLYRAGLLHDIGKLGVSNQILEKPGSLTADEWTRIREHPVRTWEILQRVRAFSDIARPAALHHERLDGSGYPWALDARRLDPAARILAVADAYEAMTSWRPYCAPLPQDTALFLLEREGGARLDAEAISALQRCLTRATDAASGEAPAVHRAGADPLAVDAAF